MVGWAEGREVHHVPLVDLAALGPPYDRALIAMIYTVVFTSSLMESYDKAQNVRKIGHETKLDRLEAAQAKKKPPVPA
ncbi:MAG TPA: hypothetical protein VN688_30155 [Gemmataceae bacterium]|nr:hypothetical protein [Gemmataceae bacterium]